MTVAPRAVISPGDAVLLCPGCSSTRFMHIHFLPNPNETEAGGKYAFTCKGCSAEFVLSIELREDQACLMWSWRK
jgi:hypothetical protein